MGRRRVKTMKKPIFAAAALVLVVGCTFFEAITAPLPPLEERYPETFAEGALDQYKRRGNSTVAGQAFLTSARGEAWFAAGIEICLVPASKYADSRIVALETRFRYLGEGYSDQQLLQTTLIDGFDKRVKEVSRSTTADRFGNFEFRNLPPGEYTIFCRLSDDMRPKGPQRAQDAQKAQKTSHFIVGRTIMLRERDTQKINLLKEI
jgi:hypothetical protein